MDENGGKKPDDEAAEPAETAPVAQYVGTPPEPKEGIRDEERISQEDLDQILEAHRPWVETKEKEGTQADLQGVYLAGVDLNGTELQRAKLQYANLQRAHLQGTNLSRANLKMTNLQDADLYQANLQGTMLFEANLQRAFLRGANLQGANLRGAFLQEAFLSNATFEERIKNEEGVPTDEWEAADLTGADLRDSDLSDATLAHVTGLLTDKLAGANLSNAKLPPDIAQFDGLARAEEISRITRPIFIGLLAGCLYSLLTIATTTDARLLTNSASSALPIIGTEIPIAGFFWVAPILLLAVYGYFHLYLQRLWTGLADLPAVFPDGRPLDKKVYPWLLSGLVRAHFKRLRDERTLLTRFENWTTILLAWWIVPLTVLVFWGRYLPRHDWIGTGLHIALLIIAIGSAILFHRHAVRTLRRDLAPFYWRNSWRDRRTYQAAVALGFGLVFSLISLGAIEGKVVRDFRQGIVGDPESVGTWVPFAFDRLGYRTYADLREKDVSTKPSGWTGLAEVDKDKLDQSLREKARAELAQVKGAQLERADLRHADAAGAFLAKADLRRANLQGADLFRAKLPRANLLGANLQDANLQNAKLQGADLFLADLQGADLQGADLRGAKLNETDLRGTDLSHSVGLTQKQLDSACGDEKTKLPRGLSIEFCKKKKPGSK